MSDSDALPTADRDPVTTGYTRPFDLDEAILLADAGDYTPDPNRVYFHELGQCLRKQVWKRLNVPIDEGQDGFPLGIGESGNAVEDRVLKLLWDAHGRRAMVLTDVPLARRQSLIDADGKTRDEYAVTGYTDPMVVGDNLQVLALTEVKSKRGWKFPKDIQAVIDEYGRKAPLSLAGIADYTEHGAANLNHLFQLAVESDILAACNRPPAQTLLQYVLAGDLDQHLNIVLSRSDVSTLAEVALDWAADFKIYLERAMQAESPEDLDAAAPPLFVMGWECRHCSYSERCAKVSDALDDGGPRRDPRFEDINVSLGWEDGDA